MNVSRGSVVDQVALLRALDSGHLSRVTLDVTDPEPLPDGHPLYAHPGVFLSPHICAYAPAVDAALQQKLIRNLLAWREGAGLEDLVRLDRGY